MRRVTLVMLVLFLSAISAFAQSNTGRLVGTVSDPGGVVPGATVLVTDNQTARERTVFASGDGTFVVPQLEPGLYTVKISTAGYKTFTATDVKIDVGKDYSLNATLEVGNIIENVTVIAGADVVNAVNAEVSNTVSTKQILELPLDGRNPLALVSLHAGVSQNGAQSTSINGQRATFTNITRDGLNIQDNFIRGNAVDFAQERPSIDDTGEFLITLQNAGADRGYGSSQIQFVTPRGGDRFHGALWEYNRNSKFSANSFFGNRTGEPKPFLNRNQFGGKLAGPILKNKLFFFGSYEGQRQRSSSSQLRTVLLPDARRGIFTYIDNSGTTRAANLFTLLPPTAGITGVNPVVAGRLIAPTPAGNSTEAGDQLNTTGYFFNQKADQNRDAFSGRIDYDINERHSINGVYTYKKERNLRPDASNNFDVIPDVVQPSGPKFLVLAYRAANPKWVNEVRGGHTRSSPLFERTSPTPESFLTSPLIDEPETAFLDQGRFQKYWNLQDTADYTMGDHSLRFGGQFQAWRINSFTQFGAVPTYTLGTNINTPLISTAQFTNSALFPGGISVGQRGTANALLALTGGIVSAGTQTFNVASQTSGFVPRQENRHLYDYENIAFYFSDQWRVSPTLSLTLGLRYEVYTALRESQGLFIEPAIGGDPVQAFLDPNGRYQFVGGNAGGNKLYKTDMNNFAPVVGFAYSPNFTNRFLGALFGGGGRTVIRGGYRMSYLNDDLVVSQQNSVGLNEGLSQTVNVINPQTGTTALNARADALPVVAPPPFRPLPRAFATNNTAAFNFFGTVFGIDPDLQTPRNQEYNFGIQRELGFQTAIEFRYVGGRSNSLVRAIDLNQIDIRDNGFLADFIRARENLLLTGNAACTSAGCRPLTVFPNLTAAGLLTNATIQGQLIAGTPADLASIYITNDLAGTVPFRANPNAGVLDLVGNFGLYRYNALQVELRRQFSKGLFLLANYTLQKTLGNASGGAIADNNSQTRFEPNLDNRQPRLEYSRVNFDQAQVFNLATIYALPFGRNRRFLNGTGVLDRIVGGWQLSSIVRASTGAPINIADPRGTLNRGAARSQRQTPQTSLTKDQIKDLAGVFRTPCGVFYINPSVVNINTTTCAGTGRAAEGFGSQPFPGQVFFNNGPGQTGQLERYFLNGPNYVNWDAGIFKRIHITEGKSVVLRADAFNVLNKTNFFTPQRQSINSATFGRMTDTFDARVMQFAARIEF